MPHKLISSDKDLKRRLNPLSFPLSKYSISFDTFNKLHNR